MSDTFNCEIMSYNKQYTIHHIRYKPYKKSSALFAFFSAIVFHIHDACMQCVRAAVAYQLLFHVYVRTLLSCTTPFFFVKVALADEAVRIGPPPALESYLKGDVILEAAKRCGAQASNERKKNVLLPVVLLQLLY